MMTCAYRIVAAIAITASLAPSLLADPMPKSLKAAYDSVNTAMSKLDYKAFAAHFHPNFVLIDPKGQETKRSDFMAMIKDLFEGHTSAKATTKVKDVHMLGNYAEVSFVLNVEITGKGGTMKFREEGTDSLVLENGKWLLYKTVQDKFTILGQ